MNELQQAAAAMGRKGGKSRSAAKVSASRKNIQIATASLSPEQRRERASKAAKACAAALTPEQRRERAKKAIAARWEKAKKNKPEGCME